MTESPPAGSAHKDQISTFSNKWKKHSGSTYVTSFSVDAILKSEKNKKTYKEKLETATGDDIFKYLLLIDTSALEGYIAQTRLQAQESFDISKKIAIAGFVLIGFGILLGIISNFIGNNLLDVGYLTSIAGILTEFISGVFFYLYNKTLQQINRFHDKLTASKECSMSLLASSSITDTGKRDDAKAELCKLLLSEEN